MDIDKRETTSARLLSSLYLPRKGPQGLISNWQESRLSMKQQSNFLVGYFGKITEENHNHIIY